MLDKIKAKIFPCENQLRALRADHASAARSNEFAHEQLRRLCDNMCPKFPPLEAHKIVNPR